MKLSKILTAIACIAVVSIPLSQADAGFGIKVPKIPGVSTKAPTSKAPVQAVKAVNGGSTVDHDPQNDAVTAHGDFRISGHCDLANAEVYSGRQVIGGRFKSDGSGTVGIICYSSPVYKVAVTDGSGNFSAMVDKSWNQVVIIKKGADHFIDGWITHSNGQVQKQGPKYGAVNKVIFVKNVGEIDK